LETKLKERFGINKLAILVVVLCSILVASAYAVGYLWSTQTTVTIATSSPYIKVYLDSQCTQEVTAINLGYLVPGASVYIRLYIKNTHPNATFMGINWNSTLGDVTDKITDDWGAGWPIYLNPGIVDVTSYFVTVASDCPLATYSWTLYLYGPG